MWQLGERAILQRCEGLWRQAVGNREIDGFFTLWRRGQASHDRIELASVERRDNAVEWLCNHGALDLHAGAEILVEINFITIQRAIWLGEVIRTKSTFRCDSDFGPLLFFCMSRSGGENQCRNEQGFEQSQGLHLNYLTQLFSDAPCGTDQRCLK